MLSQVFGKLEMRLTHWILHMKPSKGLILLDVFVWFCNIKFMNVNMNVNKNFYRYFVAGFYTTLEPWIIGQAPRNSASSPPHTVTTKGATVKQLIHFCDIHPKMALFSRILSIRSSSSKRHWRTQKTEIISLEKWLMHGLSKELMIISFWSIHQLITSFNGKNCHWTEHRRQIGSKMFWWLRFIAFKCILGGKAVGSTSVQKQRLRRGQERYG